MTYQFGAAILAAEQLLFGGRLAPSIAQFITANQLGIQAAVAADARHLRARLV